MAVLVDVVRVLTAMTAMAFLFDVGQGGVGHQGEVQGSVFKTLGSGVELRA